jgi:hypothetical protein
MNIRIFSEEELEWLPPNYEEKNRTLSLNTFENYFLKLA